MSEPKKVWWVEEGEYSDYSVKGVFSSEANATLYASVFRGNVVEIELDEYISKLKRGLKPYRIFMYRDGDTDFIDSGYDWGEETKVSLNKTYTAFGGRQFASTLLVTGWFKDEQHIAKVANEKRAQLIASGEWQPDPPNAEKREKR